MKNFKNNEIVEFTSEEIAEKVVPFLKNKKYSFFLIKSCFNKIPLKNNFKIKNVLVEKNDNGYVNLHIKEDKNTIKIFDIQKVKIGKILDNFLFVEFVNKENMHFSLVQK